MHALKGGNASDFMFQNQKQKKTNGLHHKNSGISANSIVQGPYF